MTAPVEILSRLLWIRDTAALPGAVLTDQLGLEPKALAALVKAHPQRFPESMVFHLSAAERQKTAGAPILAFTPVRGVNLLQRDRRQVPSAIIL